MFALYTPALGQVILDTFKTLDVNNGDSLLLWCTDRDLSSLPGITNLTWVKDNVAIPDVDPRLNRVANGTLLIEQARENDAGTYTCTLVAQAFLSTNTTILRVRGQDPPSSAAPMTIETSQPSDQTPLNKISPLQKKVNDLLSGKNSTNVSGIITDLANLTNPEDENKLTANELSTSLDMLVQLVRYNSERNNSAITSTTDQQNIVQVASNLLEEENTNTWLQLQEVRDNSTDELLKAMDDFGFQVSSQLDGLVILSRNIAFRVDRLKSRQMLNVDFSQYGAAIFAPEEVFSAKSATRASTIVYKTLNNVLRLQMENNGGEKNKQMRIKSGSSIISVTVSPRPSSLMRKPIKLVLNHTSKNSDVIGKCVFWEVGLPERTWLTRGCVRVDHESNARVTTCECNHLTIFAVLLNNNPVEAHHETYLKYISTAGCACPLFFLLLTFMVIAFCWKHLKSPRVSLLLHLCIAIAASCILIIVSDFVELDEVWCVVTAALLHYFLLCMFSWILSHGAIFYYLIIRAELRDKLKPKMKWFYAFGWGFPLSIVAVSLAVTGTKSYAASNCWLTLEHGLIYWAFVGPVALIILVNSVLFIFLLYRINKATKFRENMTRARHVKAWLRRSAILLPVLGITWSFGLLTFISPTSVFHYLFTIFNSLQGFFIFINFCIFDNVVRPVLIKMLCKRHNGTSVNEPAETNNRQRVQGNIPQINTATGTAKTHGRQSQGFDNVAQSTATSERRAPKIQTWMSTDI